MAWQGQGARVLTNGLGRDELAEEGAEEDENEWEGDPGQELQRQAGLHLVIGPLVGCRDTSPHSVPAWMACAHACSSGPCTRSGLTLFDLTRWCCSPLTHGEPELQEAT